MGDIGWKFPPNEGGTEDGFNDSGIETFTGARFSGLAREIIQNSLDAGEPDRGPVEVFFEITSIPTDQFPGKQEILDAFRRCKSSKGSDDDRQKNFFEKGIKILEGESINCLKIADYNTTGLGGDANSGQWNAITKARGRSEKRSQTAGGSYGFGKHAPFAVSGLRTVFYYTFIDGKGEMAQGKSILMSHEGEGGNMTQGTGFYGIRDKCHPLTDADDIPDFLRRKDNPQGTTVLVAGFEARSDWSQRIAAAIISNFFYAIHERKLEVTIEDEEGEIIAINREELLGTFDRLQNLRRTEDDFEDVDRARHFYEALISEKSIERDAELRSGLGHCKVWIRCDEEDESLPSRVAIMRKTGMIITENMKGVQRFRGCAPFAALCLCDSDEGNKLLRSMENPRHDAFEPDRLEGDEKKRGEKAVRELARWLQEKIKEQAGAPDVPASDIDEMREYFPDVDEQLPHGGDLDEERDPAGRPVIELKPTLKKKPLPEVDESDEFAEDGEGDERGGDGSGKGSKGRGAGARSTHGRSIPLENVRVIESKNGIRQILFTPMEDAKNARIRLFVAGDSVVEQLIISKATGYSMKGNCIEGVSLTRDKREKIDVQLEDKTKASIRVIAHEPIDEGHSK